MQNQFRGAVLLLLMAGGAQPALADFRVAAPPQQPAVSDTPHVDPGDVPGYSGRRVATVHRRPAAKQVIRAETVEGFGAGVPLSFACRQILPKTINVVFAPDVDPITQVDWTGGRPWAAVLRDALRPAGLTIVPHGTIIEIRK